MAMPSWEGRRNSAAPATGRPSSTGSNGRHEVLALTAAKGRSVAGSPGADRLPDGEQVMGDPAPHRLTSVGNC